MPVARIAVACGYLVSILLAAYLGVTSTGMLRGAELVLFLSLWLGSSLLAGFFVRGWALLIPVVAFAVLLYGANDPAIYGDSVLGRFYNDALNGVAFFGMMLVELLLVAVGLGVYSLERRRKRRHLAARA